MTDWLRPELVDIPARGGTLRVATWGDGPVVLAAHGLTATHREFPYLAAALGDEVKLVAPDLRGRGGSRLLPGPFSMAAHADDMIAALDHFGIDRAPLVGHSMGGFVATITAHRYPDRISHLILVDGGIRLFDVGPDVDIDMILQTVVGPSIERCSMVFPDRESYFAFWKKHPSLQDPGTWGEFWEMYCDYDLIGEADELRSGVILDAVREDGKDTLVNPEITKAILGVPCPTVLMRSPRGVLNEPQGLYSDEVGADYAQRVPLLEDELVEGTNHFTILMSTRGAERVARRVREALVAA